MLSYDRNRDVIRMPLQGLPLHSIIHCRHTGSNLLQPICRKYLTSDYLSRGQIADSFCKVSLCKKRDKKKGLVTGFIPCHKPYSKTTYPVFGVFTLPLQDCYALLSE